MKPETFLFVCLSPLVASSPLQKRQSFLQGMVNSLPASYIIHPFTVENTTPKIRSTATRKIIRYGPFKLPANTGTDTKPKEGGHEHGNSPKSPFDILLGKTSMDPNGFTTMRILSDDTMCKNCTVLAGRMDVVFENGTRADVSRGVYLHHVLTIDLDKKTKNYTANPSCSNLASTSVARTGTGLGGFIGGAVVCTLILY
jgi:hypothetical protein